MPAAAAEAEEDAEGKEMRPEGHRWDFGEG